MWKSRFCQKALFFHPENHGVTIWTRVVLHHWTTNWVCPFYSIEFGNTVSIVTLYSGVYMTITIFYFPSTYPIFGLFAALKVERRSVKRHMKALWGEPQTWKSHQEWGDTGGQEEDTKGRRTGILSFINILREKKTLQSNRWVDCREHKKKRTDSIIRAHLLKFNNEVQ